MRGCDININVLIISESQVKSLTIELDNANDLLKVARPGTKVVSEAELSSLYPLAAATSAVLKKGMSLTQVSFSTIYWTGIENVFGRIIVPKIQIYLFHLEGLKMARPLPIENGGDETMQTLHTDRVELFHLIYMPNMPQKWNTKVKNCYRHTSIYDQ